MKVPFLDLQSQYAPIRDEINAAVGRIIDTTAFVLGEAVEQFEASFARFTNRAHCVGLNSGTSALHLALLASGVGPGTDVVTTPFSWISTSWAVSYCGAHPVFADVDPETGNLDPKAAESAITPNTKAVLPVDLYGNPAALDEFEDLAQRHQLALIDDAAQAHGASLSDKIVGSFGDLACFSFYPGKNLGAAGEAGAVVTDDPDLAARIRRLRDHAQTERHHHTEIGFNYRMEGIQAAILNVKLAHLNNWNDRRRGAADRYRDLLGAVEGVRLPEATRHASPSYHLYPVRLPDRDRVMRHLAGAGIGTGIHYPTPIHLQHAYTHLGHKPGDFPNAEAYAAECLSLPMYAEITSEQQSQVAEALASALKEA